jgi:hypothetical protein
LLLCWFWAAAIPAGRSFPGASVGNFIRVTPL